MKANKSGKSRFCSDAWRCENFKPAYNPHVSACKWNKSGELECKHYKYKYRDLIKSGSD